MALVLVAAGGLGWWVPARTQRDAVVAIERAGGRVTYGLDLFDSGLPNPDGRSWYARWWIDRVGIDHVSTVREASIGSGDPGPPIDYAQLARLGGLKWLAIRSPLVADANLAWIGGLKRLRRLDLDGTGVGDAGLAHLRGLPDLRSLNLAGTQVTDAGLDLLATMSGLRSLDIKQIRATAAGVRRLRSLRPDLAIAY